MGSTWLIGGLKDMQSAISSQCFEDDDYNWPGQVGRFECLMIWSGNSLGLPLPVHFSRTYMMLRLAPESLDFVIDF